VDDLGRPRFELRAKKSRAKKSTVKGQLLDCINIYFSSDIQGGNWGRRLARNWARDLNLEEHDELTSFAFLELWSMGRVGVRARLAHAHLPGDFCEGQLLQAACRLSCDIARDSTDFENVLERIEETVDPLWPALARHIARRSTPDDRALLEDLARHPEKREPPLSWGLQFIVRGDVMDDDGNVLQLDDLCDELALPRLPYLEDMPDELDVAWDAED
jgi:hypothetical protein